MSFSSAINCLEIIGLTSTRLRVLEYDLNFGSVDPISGGLSVALGSALQLLQGAKEFGTSLSNVLKEVNSHPSATGRSGSSISDGLKGIRRSSRAVIRVPIDIGVAVTQGVHNSPRLWGGQVQRKQPCVKDFGSGLKAGGNVSNYCFPDVSACYPNIV